MGSIPEDISRPVWEFRLGWFSRVLSPGDSRVIRVCYLLRQWTGTASTPFFGDSTRKEIGRLIGYTMTNPKGDLTDPNNPKNIIMTFAIHLLKDFFGTKSVRFLYI